ncbi:hypothetical protein BOO69_11180 [Sulfitobacter alexandrii]|uniref:Uncharacterized protein n=1 Tax=Sulfitobacter alexandrii TaxID=1917485 RepID=A0A1J0WHX0_9RHOB|nr:hypothetical protein [Sulfitobacter alexandrii]APE43907.1 hypothetical protein BOO69_11180 [Sulfitobacter alexandrii]
MGKLALCVAVVCLATQPLRADDLLPRLEAAQGAIDARMLTVMGADPAGARWSAARRAASGCALRELERMKGRAAAETYVRAVENGAAKAARLRAAADFGGLAARIHAAAGLRLQRDIVPITRACGVGL